MLFRSDHVGSGPCKPHRSPPSHSPASPSSSEQGTAAPRPSSPRANCISTWSNSPCSRAAPHLPLHPPPLRPRTPVPIVSHSSACDVCGNRGCRCCFCPRVTKFSKIADVSEVATAGYEADITRRASTLPLYASALSDTIVFAAAATFPYRYIHSPFHHYSCPTSSQFFHMGNEYCLSFSHSRVDAYFENLLARCSCCNALVFGSLSADCSSTY